MLDADKRALIGVCKSILSGAFNKHIQGDSPNLWLAGSRRSGTTMLMEAIAKSPGVKYSDQPFSLYSADTSLLIRKIPVYDGGLIISPDDEEFRRLKTYIREIVDGELHVNENWRFWERDFDRISNRIVFKVTDAQYISEWVSDNLGFQILHLTRHPIPQSLSVLRYNWGNQARYFLRNEAFGEKYLDGGLDSRCYDILSKGNVLDQHVLGWTLENLGTLRHVKSRADWCSVTYERLVSDRSLTISRICEKLDLKGVDVAELVASKSSKTRGKRFRVEGQNDRGYQALLTHWQSEVDSAEARKAMEVLDWFDVDLYRWDDWQSHSSAM